MYELAADLTLNIDGSLYIDADNGEARLTNGGGTFTPAHEADIVTKSYVDTAGGGGGRGTWSGYISAGQAAASAINVMNGEYRVMLSTATPMFPNFADSMDTWDALHNGASVLEMDYWDGLTMTEIVGIGGWRVVSSDTKFNHLKGYYINQDASNGVYLNPQILVLADLGSDKVQILGKDGDLTTPFGNQFVNNTSAGADGYWPIPGSPYESNTVLAGSLITLAVGCVGLANNQINFWLELS